MAFIAIFMVIVLKRTACEEVGGRFVLIILSVNYRGYIMFYCKV